MKKWRDKNALCIFFSFFPFGTGGVPRMKWSEGRSCSGVWWQCTEYFCIHQKWKFFVIQIFHSAFWSHCTVRWLQGVCWSMWVCEGGWRDCYVVFNSLMACGKKLLWNLPVLLRRLRSLFPESSSENGPWWGLEVSLWMLWALVRQHFFSVSWMRGCELPSSAVLKYSIATTEPQAWL